MLVYVAIWVALGCIGGLAHIWLVSAAEDQDVISEEESKTLLKLSPMIVATGPLGLGWVLGNIVAAFFEEDR